MVSASTKANRAVGFVRADSAALSEHGRPFFCVRLSKEAVEALIGYLEECAKHPRTWFTLASIEPNLERLSIIRTQTPEYEKAAADGYARGELFRVSGKKKSCNIDFSGEDGSEYLARKLKRVMARMQEFMEIRVPSAKRNLVEFRPDTEMNGALDDMEKLAIAGEKLAGEELGPEDFSDWETSR